MLSRTNHICSCQGSKQRKQFKWCNAPIGEAETQAHTFKNIRWFENCKVEGSDLAKQTWRSYSWNNTSRSDSLFCYHFTGLGNVTFHVASGKCRVPLCILWDKWFAPDKVSRNQLCKNNSSPHAGGFMKTTGVLKRYRMWNTEQRHWLHPLKNKRRCGSLGIL